MPEWPNGTALKAVADRNASRGFESRPLCVSTYRVDRAHAAVLSGVLLIAAGVLAFVAFVLTSTVVAGLVVVLLLAAAYAVARPPVIVRLDADGFRARGVRGRWDDVTGVRTEESTLVLEGEGGARHRIGLASVGRRSHELAREVHDRMNVARGYRPYEPGD